MLIAGIINPLVQSLLCRVRHTNALVIADVAFPSWPTVETVDLSLIRGVPTVLQLLEAIVPIFKCGPIYMAEEFKQHNSFDVQSAVLRACGSVTPTFEPHLQFKLRVPHAIGLIRTGDPTLYSNVILVSA
jgi:D-ribose pyranase